MKLPSDLTFSTFDTAVHDRRKVGDILAAALGNPSPERLAGLFDVYGATPDRTLYVAECDGQPVGVIGVQKADGPGGLIVHLAVHPDLRRRGIGRYLIDAATKARGLTAVTAETDQDAVEFYRACGFDMREIGSPWPDVRRFRGLRTRARTEVD